VGRRWSQQQFAQIRGEHGDGVLVSDLTQRGQHLARYRRFQETRVTVADGGFQLAPEQETTVGEPLPLERWDDRLVVDLDHHRERVLGLAPPHREEPVRREPSNWFPVVVELFEAMVVTGVAALLPGPDEAAAQLTAQPGAGRGRLGPAFGDDVAGAAQRCFFVGDTLPRIDVRSQDRGASGPAIDLGREKVGKRFEPTLARDRRAGLARGLERPTEVVDLVRVTGTDDGLLELGFQRALLGNRFQSSVLPVNQIPCGGDGVVDSADLHLVESARALLPIPGDEGHRVAAGEQLHHARDGPWRQPEGGGDRHGHDRRIEDDVGWR